MAPCTSARSTRPAMPLFLTARTHWRAGLTRPAIMGIVNVTPDSFSDGGPLRQS